MNLFRYLKENQLLNQIKDSLIQPLHNIQNLISQYVLIGNNKEQLLNQLEQNLNQVTDIFKDVGFEYEPEAVPDEDDKVFSNILDKYKEQIAYFLNNYNDKLFEQFNVQTQYVLNLIEVHKLSIKGEK